MEVCWRDEQAYQRQSLGALSKLGEMEERFILALALDVRTFYSGDTSKI